MTDAPAPPVAWLVDLDGTLYRAGPVKLLMAAELAVAGWAAIATIRRFRAAHEELRQLPSTAPDPFRAQLEHTARALAMEPADVERIVVEWMHERPGKWIRLFRRRAFFAEIRAARSRGIRTALVSDYPASQKLKSLAALELFDAVVASGEPGGPRRLKPDPEGYLAAAERLGAPPERCLVLGDRADADGAAARAAGMAFRLIC